MTIFLRFFLSSILFATFTGKDRSSPVSAQEQELRRLEFELARLEQQNDSAISKILAEDWICVGPRTLSKQEFLENVKRNLATHENGVKPYTITKENIVIHIFEETAVVTSLKTYRQTPDTTKGFSEDDTDVFTHGAGGWLLRFSRIAPVQQQAASN